MPTRLDLVARDKRKRKKGKGKSLTSKSALCHSLVSFDWFAFHSPGRKNAFTMIT